MASDRSTEAEEHPDRAESHRRLGGRRTAPELEQALAVTELRLAKTMEEVRMLVKNLEHEIGRLSHRNGCARASEYAWGEPDGYCSCGLARVRETVRALARL